MDNDSYLAGMIDADGSIYMNLQKSGALNLRVLVYNASKDLMDWLTLNYNGNYHAIKRNYKPNWQKLYQWEIGGEAACRLLVSIKDKMIVKRPRAELAIEAWSRKGNFRGSKVPLEVLEVRRNYVNDLHKLNQPMLESY